MLPRYGTGYRWMDLWGRRQFKIYIPMELKIGFLVAVPVAVPRNLPKGWTRVYFRTTVLTWAMLPTRFRLESFQEKLQHHSKICKAQVEINNSNRNSSWGKY